MRKYRTKGHEQVLYYVLESYSVWFLWQKFILFCQKLMTFLMHQGFINFFRLNSLNHIICWKCITSMFIWRNFLHCMKNIFFSLKFLPFFLSIFFLHNFRGDIQGAIAFYTLVRSFFSHFTILFCQNLVQYHMIEIFWCQTHHIFDFVCISWQVISNVKLFFVLFYCSNK